MDPHWAWQKINPFQSSSLRKSRGSRLFYGLKKPLLLSL
ncbi:hypothetical protein GPUN_2900 [Glaciecola punicea ACAM 611]|uniref:Uncharacterized protein n=1 Tax=Glaciecola punicea ACAM 611 TaxID=1121923 RepID=H5TF87_9ALTE|nr:hypothetical protein GPUN_2900 [Glaciecola punicea ACAM 611]